VLKVKPLDYFLYIRRKKYKKYFCFENLEKEQQTEEQEKKCKYAVLREKP